MKEQLVRLVLQMYGAALHTPKQCGNFRGVYHCSSPRHEWKSGQSCGEIGHAPNTLRRNLQELGLDIKSMRASRRRPPVSARPIAMRDSAVKLVDDLAGESPASANCPVGTVAISGEGAGDQTVGSPEVNALDGWTQVRSAPTGG